MVTYTKNSPYYLTTATQTYLNVMTFRTIPAYDDDILFTVTKEYEFRPDLLAYDLYNDDRLWWVFVMRNLTVIEDPVFDLTAGTQIYLPKLSTLKDSLGL